MKKQQIIPDLASLYIFNLFVTSKIEGFESKYTRREAKSCFHEPRCLNPSSPSTLLHFKCLSLKRARSFSLITLLQEKHFFLAPGGALNKISRWLTCQMCCMDKVHLGSSGFRFFHLVPALL